MKHITNIPHQHDGNPIVGDVRYNANTQYAEVFNSDREWSSIINPMPGTSTAPSTTNRVYEEMKDAPLIPNNMYMHKSWPDWAPIIAPLYAEILAGMLTNADTSAARQQLDELVEQWNTFNAIADDPTSLEWDGDVQVQPMSPPAGKIFSMTPARFAQEYTCDFSSSAATGPEKDK